MTMYLPNSDLQPTGSEIAEFLDVPLMAEPPDKTNRPLDRLSSATPDDILTDTTGPTTSTQPNPARGDGGHGP